MVCKVSSTVVWPLNCSPVHDAHVMRGRPQVVHVESAHLPGLVGAARTIISTAEAAPVSLISTTHPFEIFSVSRNRDASKPRRPGASSSLRMSSTLMGLPLRHERAMRCRSSSHPRKRSMLDALPCSFKGSSLLRRLPWRAGCAQASLPAQRAGRRSRLHSKRASAHKHSRHVLAIP